MALRMFAFVFIAAWVLSAVPAHAQSNAPAPPPQEPILRIDPGMHNAQIQRIGVDAGCKLLATGSWDKTVRLWRLPEGKLLRTLRTSIGPENHGQVYAVAVAPDGSWVAAGGWGGAYPRPRAHFVDIFESATGAISARLGPFENVINNLTVSSDGRFLAVSLAAGHGLRVWEKTPTSWRLVGEDKDYGGQTSFSAAFDSAGLLYTVAEDGKLRQYRSGFRAKPVVVATRGGIRPYSVAVHPSRDRVAVGYNDSTAVDVYEASTLAWRYAADTKGLDNGNLGSVAWSADGERLYAGGTYYAKDNTSPVLTWNRWGQGRPGVIEGADNTIMHILPCGERIAFGAFDPAFGLVAKGGNRELWKLGHQPDHRGVRGSGPAATVDGRGIHFGLEQWGKSPVLFDLMTEQLTESPIPPNNVVGADQNSLPISGWYDDYSPNLGGTQLKLDYLEKSRSLAIAPDQQRFVLGSDWTLRGYDREGGLKWSTHAPSTVWGVNIAPNGKLVIGGYGDGTIRWHRLTDGQELLALFVHKLDRRWVAWTPKGYYIASPGAESLIGWHVNGKTWDEAAQFYSADRFRDQFNRPDIVKLVLETLDERQAIEEANKSAKVTRAVESVRAAAPPIVTIQNPGDETSFRSPQVTITYDLFSENGKETRIDDVRINNSTLRANITPGTKKNKNWTSGQHTLTLPPRDVTVTFVARDEDDRPSEPVSIRLRWDGAKPGEIARPRLRALFVGVDAYTALNKLRYAGKDAADLAAFFKSQEGKSYSKVDAKVLPRDAKRADVIKGLDWLERESEAGILSDVNLLFLAGHGVTDEKQNFYYMAADGDPLAIRATAVGKDDILRTIRNLKGARVVMLDTCYSGAGADAASRVDMSRAINEFGDQSLGVLIYASAQGRQYSEERDEWGNGAFTKAMIEGLSGKADSQKLGVVEADELGLYVRRRVKSMTDNRQVPAHTLPFAAPDMQLVLFK